MGEMSSERVQQAAGVLCSVQTRAELQAEVLLGHAPQPSANVSETVLVGPGMFSFIRELLFAMEPGSNSAVVPSLTVGMSPLVLVPKSEELRSATSRVK